MRSERELHLLLGRDEDRYGAFRFEELKSVAWALSVGSDRQSPALAFKGDPKIPNEDGLLVLSQGPRLLLAVADGHLGIEASHTLLKRLANNCLSLPTDRGELAVTLLALSDPPCPGPSATTLVVTCLNLETGQGFGLSWGDSSVVLLGPGVVTQLTRGTQHYLPAGCPAEPERAESFQYCLEAGKLLAVYTDGINECHYGSPLTSVGLQDLRDLFSMTGPDAPAFAEGLAKTALTGVRGFPGGQDNFALIVVAG